MVTWKETTLGTIGTFSKGRGISKSEAHSGKIPCVRYGEIYTAHNDYVKSYYSHISGEVAATSRLLRKGELLFAGSGETKEEIGKCVAFIDDCEAYAGGDIIVLTPYSDNDSLFLGYYLNSRKVAEQKTSRGQGDAIVHISASSLAEIEILLPSLPEQRAIAAVLSDADAYIAALEKLIAKKRNIKKGAMQELLTGKRRLPGFEGEWVEKSLDDLFDFFGGLSASRADLSSKGYPYLHYGDIHGSTKTFIDVCVDGSIPRLDVDLNKVSNTSLLNDGDVVFVDASEDNEGASRHIVVRNYARKPFISGLHTIVAKAKTNELYNRFREFCFQTAAVKSQFKYYAVGTKVTGVSKTTIGKVILSFPQSKSEQTAIAAILSDMDAEIDALTAKLNKLRNIKQGMMSELLTGHIRLIEQEAEAAPVEVAATKIVNLPKRKPEAAAAQTSGHNQQFDDAVMIAGIVNVLYSDKFPLGRKKVQKCLYLLRRHQDESTAAFKKKAAGPYADEVRYKGGEPIARSANYIATTTAKDKGTTFARGEKISQAFGYIQSWGKQADIKWVADKLKFKKVDELELLATVDMAICDLTEAGTLVSVASIKHLIVTNEEWRAKLKKQTFNDANIARAIRELQALL